MTLNQNQFALEPVQGAVDLQYNGSVITGRVASTQVTDLIAGQAVKLADVAGGVPAVVALAADTDESFGFVTRNLKDIDYPAGAALEIASFNSVMYMTAGAAIARGAKVEFVSATNKVITAAGVNPICGFALDKAAGDNSLIRVWILNPYANPSTIADIAGLQAALNARTQTVLVTASLAEINAGKELIPAPGAGFKLRVVDFIQRVSGNFAVTTSVDVQDESATKVAVAAVAALTDGSILIPGTANVTLGAGFGIDLTENEALEVANVGTAATTGTSITYTITYAVVPA